MTKGISISLFLIARIAGVLSVSILCLSSRYLIYAFTDIRAIYRP